MTVPAPTLAVTSSMAAGQTNLTNSKSLTVGGTAVANTTVQVFDGGTLIGTAAVNASGVWSFTTATLLDGWHSFTAVNKDGGGATSTPSAALGIAVDTRAPSVPSIVSFS